MLVTEIFDKIVNESGQFIYLPDELEINQDIFRSLVKVSLGTYSKYSPVESRIQINVLNQAYTFPINTTKQTNGSFLTSSVELKARPRWIADAMPLLVNSTTLAANLLLNSLGINGSSLQHESYEPKIPYMSKYIDGVLYLPAPGNYDILCCYDHEIIQDATDPVNPIYSVPSISDIDDDLVKLILGKFLIALGRNRRAMVLSDIPITTDALDLVQEGKTLEDEAILSISENQSKFYLAYQ